MSEPVKVTDSEFKAVVLESPVPVVVDFWAPWCGPCRAIAPTLDQLAKEYGDKIKIAKVNTDENHEYAMQYGVQGIPTMLFVSGGEVVDRAVGALPKPMLQQRIDNLLKTSQEAPVAA